MDTLPSSRIRAPFAPPEEVRAAQFRRLTALLAHAEAKVPYYRELFRSLGIRSRDIRSRARLRPKRRSPKRGRNASETPSRMERSDAPCEVAILDPIEP